MFDAAFLLSDKKADCWNRISGRGLKSEYKIVQVGIYSLFPPDLSNVFTYRPYVLFNVSYIYRYHVDLSVHRRQKGLNDDNFRHGFIDGVRPGNDPHSEHREHDRANGAQDFEDSTVHKLSDRW